jgi:hypothetical protein
MAQGKEYCERKINLLKSNFDELSEVRSCQTYLELHPLLFLPTTTTTNQSFYSQVSWGRLKMKPHEPKKVGTKQEEKRREKQRAIKKSNQKREKRQ